MAQTNRTTVVLGDEFDEALRNDVREVLQNLGASIKQEDWGVAGSQELDVITVVLRGYDLTIESETYVGLSITGPEDMLVEIKNLVVEKQRQRTGG